MPTPESHVAHRLATALTARYDGATPLTEIDVSGRPVALVASRSEGGPFRIDFALLLEASIVSLADACGAGIIIACSTMDGDTRQADLEAALPTMVVRDLPTKLRYGHAVEIATDHLPARRLRFYVGLAAPSFRGEDVIYGGYQHDLVHDTRHPFGPEEIRF